MEMNSSPDNDIHLFIPHSVQSGREGDPIRGMLTPFCSWEIVSDLGLLIVPADC